MKAKPNNNLKFRIFTIIGFNLILNIVGLGLTKLSTTAQTNTSNSLEKPINDPLVPPHNIERDLSNLEIKRIQQEIVKINQQATKELKQGNLELAFQLWFRELRLQRVLGLEPEIMALGRIGNIAWEQNRQNELRAIAQRLFTIEETKLINNFEPNLLSAIGLAYQQIKYLDRAVGIYQIMLKKARQQDDLIAEKNNLEQLGELYLDTFNYSSARLVYEELLNLIQNNSTIQASGEMMEVYLINLVKIYQNLQQLESAIAIQKKLIDKYLTEEKISSVAKLKITVGNDYQNLQQAKLASQYYQEAYTLAQSLQQIALAVDALTHLATLYQQENQWQLAIAIYQQLIDLQQKANNYYGLINAYEQLGNIYLEIEEYSKALESFEVGLMVATSLNYRVDYFTNKVQQLK